jgi:hypothetical protein
LFQRVAAPFSPAPIITMNSQGQSEVSPEAMQSRIQQARREAETLKDRIKRKKDELADTTRTSLNCSSNGGALAIN